MPLTLTRKTGLAAACLCFALHTGLISHHLWYGASARNTLQPPAVPDFFEKGLLRSWHASFDLNRWDSAHYEAIARTGYAVREDPARASFLIQWYPGLPLIAGALARVTAWPLTKVLSFVSLLCTLSFWVLLWSPRLVRRLGERATVLTSVCVICWPGAFFWFAGMTEPLLAALGLAALRSEFMGTRWRTAWVLGLGTLVKHSFLPLSLAWAGLRLLRERARIRGLVAWGAVSCWGFALFALYCGLRFGDPLLMFRTMVSWAHKQVRVGSLVDLPHFAAQIETFGGVVAFGALLFLAGWFLWNLPSGGMGNSLAGAAAGDPSGDGLFLWWAALSLTCYFTIGDAHYTETFKPYQAIMRYQTSNVFLFLLAGRTLARVDPRRLVALALPVCVVAVIWQRIFTIRYWSWWWVA